MAIFSTKRIIILLVCCFFLTSAFIVLGFGYYLVHPAREGAEPQLFVVANGATLSDVIEGLDQAEIINGKPFVLLWSRAMGYGAHIKAGEYHLSAGMPPLRILDVLSKGMVVTHAITIPEGYTRTQIADLMAGKGLADRERFLALTGAESACGRYGLSCVTLEGYLYPDTYLVARGLSEAAIIDILVKRFQDVTAPLMERIQGCGMSLHEVVTLASIVEKETGRPEERPLIASVFLNRLKRNMRLESDPTVIYGIRDFNGNLTRRDLETPTPYNTYLISGLPPGPIASPGLSSIKAVLDPADTDFLFFVSKNDGTHHFSRTYLEHSRAVGVYQKRRRLRTSKSP